MTRLATPGRLFGLAVIASILTWLMLLIGGTVNPTGSSLACLDWAFTWFGMPLCNGELFPPMTDGVQYEHGHRLWGWLVGVATVAIALWTLFDRTLPRATRHLALGAVFLVLAQGALGGITVLLGLNPWLSTAHLLLGYSFLGLLVYIAWRVHPTRRAAPHAGATLPRALLGLAVVLIVAQVLLGGAIRHFGAGMICGDDWLTCGAEGLWPSLGLAQLHMTHRLFGYLVVAAVIAIGVLARRRALAAGRPLAAWLAITPAALALVQVALGILTVATGKVVAIVTLHTAIGGLLMTAAVTAYIAFGPLGDPSTAGQVSPPAGSTQAGGAALGVAR